MIFLIFKSNFLTGLNSIIVILAATINNTITTSKIVAIPMPGPMYNVMFVF
jgi:hypothetical protein